MTYEQLDLEDGMSKILLVEDNAMNREMLARRLIRRGFEVILADNGQLALDMAAVESPDLILMDLSLPIMDGWEATKALKFNPYTASIPIIALTAHAMQSDRDEALAAGCDDYDTKPINLTRLLEKIGQYLSTQ